MEAKDISNPAASPPVGLEDELTFLDVVRFFRRSWKLIAGLALGAGLVAGVALWYLLPYKWEASATLVVMSSRFTSGLRPPTLTVQGYQKLLESDAVVSETKDRLIEKGGLDKNSRLRVGGNLKTLIFVSRRAEETSLAPMVQAIAYGETAERAASIVNTWVEVFLQRVSQINEGTTAATVKFIDEQYPQIRDTLIDSENDRVAAEKDYQRRYNEATAKWNQRITDFKAERAEKTNNYHAETRRISDEFRSQRNLSTRRARLNAMQAAFGEMQDEQSKVSTTLKQKVLELEAARKELVETPVHITLYKAITDDALWRRMTENNTRQADWEKLRKEGLATQEINPVYVELSSRTSRVAMEVNALSPRSTQMADELNRMVAEIKTLEVALSSDEASLEKLERDRNSGLVKLEEGLQNDLEELLRNKEQELNAIQVEWEARNGQMTRDISNLRKLFEELASRYNQALLAKAEQGIEDISLGSPAVPPDLPVSRGILVKALMAAIFGGLLGFCIALIRTAGGNVSSES
ncbi:MAG: hypothetical protein HY788_20675 [Deltaproteobacteria bacterium]|nr:hypothetical protein [Deltaproteobacteria bacterium]